MARVCISCVITLMVICQHQTTGTMIKGFYNNTPCDVAVTCAILNVVPWCLDASGTWARFTASAPCPNIILYIPECQNGQPLLPCSSSPCANGGSCFSAGLGYQCTCPSGYTGTNCQTFLPCSSSPCANGGSCVSAGLGYQCTCPNGYTGTNCQTFLPCSSSPCANGGSCVSAGLGYQCTCPSGYTGTNCQSSVGPWIYFTEHGSPGYITALSPSGVQTRLSQSGGANEVGVAVDTLNSMIYYTMISPNSVWRASLTNVSDTKVMIWRAPNYADGLALSTTDQLIFVDQNSGVAMLDYVGALVQMQSINKGISNGLAVDQSARILYFTEESNNQIWKAVYTTSGWVGSATVLLSGVGTGQVGATPEGIILEAGWLYWNLLYTSEIRSMLINGTSSVTVVPAGPSGVTSYGLGKKGSVFYYTSATSNGGIWQVIAGGTRTKITPNTTLYTDGITVI